MSFLNKVRANGGDYRLTLAALLLLGVTFFLSAGRTAADTPVDQLAFPHVCRDVHVPTSIPSGAVTIYGRLCEPIGFHSQTIQLLVHGGTYKDTYWDFPGFNGKYSYVQAANASGYATLAIDRLGYGQSTRPLSQYVTYDNEVSTLHAVVQAIRSGSLGIHVRGVEAIGHSLGSGDVTGLAAAYPHDLDAIILTGFGQQVNPNLAKLNARYFVAANSLSRFANLGLDANYRTNAPGTRGIGGLYYLPLADPQVVAADQNTEDTVTTTEILSRPQGGTVPSAQLTVPVLLADGQYDEHYCLDNNIDQPDHVSPNCASSQAFWQLNAPNYPSACLSTALLKSGHDINLHVTARKSFQILLYWSWQTIPPYSGTATCARTGSITNAPGALAIR